MSVPEGYKSLGKIGISYKGDYNSNTAYERLDAVFHNGSTYLAIKDAPDGAPRDDKTNWIYLAKGYDGETVDVADSEIAFTDSETRENISTGEKVSTVFGKIKKFFADLAAPAFAQMITTKEDLLATKVTGYVPDAKAVADVASELTRNLSVRYNADTDTVQIYYDGAWVDWSAANLQVINIFTNGNYVNDCALAGRDNATQTISNYLIINGQPSGVFVGIMISIPNIIDHIVAGKKLHITCKLDKYDSSSLLLIIDSATNSNHNSGKQVTKTINTTMTEYVFDLKNCGFSDTYKNLFVGLYSYVGCPYYNLYIEKMWLA